jgi:hypothetical protein
VLEATEIAKADGNEARQLCFKAFSR